MSSSLDLSLQPARIMVRPTTFGRAGGRWHGIPGVEVTRSGRLVATWYSGGDGEGPGNYVVLAQSDDDGRTWSDPVLAVVPSAPVRAFDPALWMDPRERLWLYWTQSYDLWDGRGGVWAARCDDPDRDLESWTPPRRLADGVMMNKPVVVGDGSWLYPVAGWGTVNPVRPELADRSGSNVYRSTDDGETVEFRGTAQIPHRAFDEHMVVERTDASLWMLVRTTYGIGQSESFDGGVSWSPGRPTSISAPDSRFHIRRLPDRSLLYVGHRDNRDRSHLIARLSDDDGCTWGDPMMLDERVRVSYPDAAVRHDGTIYVIYDRERSGAREILIAKFDADDVRQGSTRPRRGYVRRIVDGD